MLTITSRTAGAPAAFRKDAWLLLTKLAVREADQAIELVGDLSQTQVNVGHALFVKRSAVGLHLLHLRSAALDFGHDY